MTNVTCGLTAKKPGSAPSPMLVIEYGTTLLYFAYAGCEALYLWGDHALIPKLCECDILGEIYQLYNFCVLGSSVELIRC